MENKELIGLSINKAMIIFKQFNDIYYRKDDDPESNIVYVMRDTGHLDCEPFDYASLKMKDFFDAKNNKRFAAVCPTLISTDDMEGIGVYMQIHNTTTGEERDFAMVRNNLGELLGSIAEMTAGDHLSDRGNGEYVFGKPISIDGFHKQFMSEMTQKGNALLLEYIRTKSEALKKYCSRKTRGIGSVMRAVNRITEDDLDGYQIKKVTIE